MGAGCNGSHRLLYVKDIDLKPEISSSQTPETIKFMLSFFQFRLTTRAI